MSANTITVDQITATIEKNFPFSVERFPLTGPDNTPTPHYGLFRSDNNQVIGRAVTRKYQPHTNEDVCVLAEAASMAFDGIATLRTSWFDGHFLTLSPSEEMQRFVYDTRNPTTNDAYIPRLIINAGYDGTAFKASFGIYRIICRNLMTIPVKGKTVEVSIRHSSKLRSRIDELVESFRSVIVQADDVANVIDRANQKNVNIETFLNSVYPVAKDSSERILKNHQDRIGQIMTRLYTERNALGLPSDDCTTATAWEAFNAVQGYEQHDKRRNGGVTVEDRAIMALSELSVRRASALAFA